MHANAVMTVNELKSLRGRGELLSRPRSFCLLFVRLLRGVVFSPVRERERERERMKESLLPLKGAVPLSSSVIAIVIDGIL